MGTGLRWLTGLVMVSALAVVGVYTYNLGFAHGLGEAARTVAPGGAGPVVAWWPRPWGFGFFPLFPLLFILFWILVLRAVFWRGAWYGRGCGGYIGVPPAFEEWHRRAHGGDVVKTAPGSNT